MSRIKQAWAIIRQNPAPLLGITLAYSVIEFSLTKVMTPHFSTISLGTFFGPDFFTILLGMLGFEVLRLIFITGFFPMVLIALDGGEISVSSFKLFMTKKRLMNMLILDAVVLPVLFAGLILLIVPGVIWFIVSIMAYFIVAGDENAGILDSVSKSITITKGFRWIILGYLTVYFLLSMISTMIPYFVVLLDTLLSALFYLVLALIYRECMNKNVG
jgi:uncharacterized membrane protein